MTDNEDGTYSYSFTSTSNGKLTVFAYLENNTSGVYAVFWNNVNLSENPDKTWMYTSISQTWNTLVTTTQIDQTSGRLTTYLTVPQNDTYTIYYLHDNGGRLYFSGSLEINNWADVVQLKKITLKLKLKWLNVFRNSNNFRYIIPFAWFQINRLNSDNNLEKSTSAIILLIVFLQLAPSLFLIF